MTVWFLQRRGWLIGLLGLVGITILFVQYSKQENDQERSALASDAASPTQPRGSKDQTTKRREIKRTGNQKNSAELQAIYVRWEKAKRELTGQPLLEARRGIARDAALQLGASDLLLDFIGFLDTEGQGDLKEWLVSEGMRELFASPEKGEATLEWLVSIEDEKLQASMCFAAGQAFRGPAFKTYLNEFPNIHAQSRLLGGYFSEMAKRDPAGAVKGFFATKPPKVDFTALKHVTAAVPPGSDFPAISAMFPGDSQTLAKNARRALLGAWAASAPQSAADYILSNTKLVHSDQLGPVMETWMHQDPVGAAVWTEGLAAGEHRDVAFASRSESLAAQDPAQAWPLAIAVADQKRREQAMQEVYQLWMKKDPKAADAAWKQAHVEKR